MDALDRLTSFHNINKPNSTDLDKEVLEQQSDSLLDEDTSHEGEKLTDLSASKEDEEDEHTSQRDDGANCDEQNTSVDECLRDNSCDGDLQYLENKITCDGDEEKEDGGEIEKQSFESGIPVGEDLIQFWSPAVQNKIKSRFQPKRKSSSKKIDYSDKKKRKRKSGRFFAKKSKKDEPIKKTKVSRVSRRSVMEISKMKKLRKQTRENRVRNEKNMKLALMSGGYVPVRSTAVTKPKEFKFSLRNKAKEAQLGEKTCPEKTFETGLRNDSIAHTFKNESTMPVPFNFKLSQRTTEETKKWESFAQSTMKFQTRTPTRYRNKPSEEDKSFLEKKSEKKESHVTMPITPKLLTRGRSRRYKIEAAKDQEEKEIEEMRNYKFKATELNPKILEKKGMYGVKTVPVSSTTEPKPFMFEIEQRIFNRTSKDTTLMEEDTTTQNKSKVTSSGKLKPTQPKPFSFESKDKARYMKKEEKIKEQILAEKKLHDFQAGLLPSFSPDTLPSVPTRKRTKLKPFNISSGSLSYQTKFDITMKMEESEEQAKRRFKAQSADVVKKQPFQPASGLIPPTKISNVMLNTDLRAEERELKQYWKKQKENIQEEERARIEKEKKLAEEVEVKKLRKKAVHKAKPIPNFKPLKVKKSDLPPTIPETPNLEVKKRALVRFENSRIAEK